MEQALSMAQTHLARRDNIARMPPMAYVEDLFSKEPNQVPLEHLLFTVPDNWHPPSQFREEDTMVSIEKQQGSNTGAEHFDEFPTCYIEEEIPEELDSPKATLAVGHTSDKGTKGGEDDGAGMEQQREVVPNETEENIPRGTMREGGKVFSPPSILSMHEQWHVPPPFFHPEHLKLLFDLRG